MRELLRIGGMCVYDLLEDRFSLPLLKGALALDAVLGTNYGPRSPGTVASLLYRCAASQGADALAQPEGGLGAVSEALARAARAAGAEIRTGALVERILVREDRVAGVVLASRRRDRRDHRGVERRSQEHLPRAAGDGAPRCGLRAARDPAALARAYGEAAPGARAAAAVPRARAEALRARLLVAPSADYIERAYNHAKYDEFSRRPMLEITIPTAQRRNSCAARQARHVGDRAVRPVCARRRLGGPAPGLHGARHRHSRGLRAAAARLHQRQRTADAAGYRARVPHQRRPLASRRARARSVPHGASGAGRGADTARRCRACSCAAPAAIRAAASWDSPDATRRGSSCARPPKPCSPRANRTIASRC